MKHPFYFVKKSFLIMGLSCFLSSIAMPAHADNHLIIAERKGDRGMPAPYTHHKNGPGYIFTSYLFDSLIGQNSAGDAVPALASGWSVSDDGLVYDISLNKHARWHDGQDFSADDVVFTIGYMQKHPYYFASTANIDKVKTQSDDSVRITLKQRDMGIITHLMSMPIIPAHIYQDQGTPEHFVDKSAMIGSGPYKFISYDKAQGRYLFEKNEQYYNGTPKYDRVAILKMSPDAAVKAMAQGKVSIFSGFPAHKTPLAEQAGLSVFNFSSNHPIRLKYNHQGLFKHQELRHALAYILDRQALLDIAYPKYGELAQTGYFQASSPWYSPSDYPDYAVNHQAASKLLEEQGWKKSAEEGWIKNNKPLTLNFIVEKRYKKLAQVVYEQLTNFGIKVDFRVMEKPALNQRMREGQFDISLQSSSTMGDPNNVIPRIFGKSPKSDGYQGDGTLKALMTKQSSAANNSERAILLKQFQSLYARKLPSYLLINPVWSVVYNDQVSPVVIKNGVAFGIPTAIPKNILLTKK